MNATLDAARRQMIDQQVRAWEVLDDRVLAALAGVRREDFVPEGYREVAFADTAIPLAHGQHMLPPKVEGRILQALALQPDDEVLEIGTGSGFFAACLARLVRRVRSIEIYPDLAQGAVRALAAATVTNVTVETGDALQIGDSDRYDAIAVTGSLPVYDDRFERALKIGGRLFVVVGQAPVMEARLITRTGQDDWAADTLFETVIDPLINATQPPGFIF
jgi:protein-L-isoaspartate(D-aspartate) O-methyltransferase